MSQMEVRPNNKTKKTKNARKLLNKLKCVAPGCILPLSTRSDTRREAPVIKEYSRDRHEHTEQPIVSTLAKAQTKAKLSIESYSGHSSAEECNPNKYKTWKERRIYDDAVEVVSDNSDVAQPRISTKSIQEDHEVSSQLSGLLNPITTSTSDTTTATLSTTVSSTSPTHVTIVEQRSSSGTDKRKIDNMEQDVLIPTVLTNISQHKPNLTHISKSQLHLKQLLKNIIVMAHDDDAQKNALDSFHQIQISSPKTHLQSNNSFTEDSLLQLHHRQSPLHSPLVVTNTSVVPSPLQLSDHFSDLIRRYEKLEQFIKTDESISLTTTIIADSNNETEIDNENRTECFPLCTDESTVFQCTILKQCQHEPTSTSVSMVKVMDQEHTVLLPCVTWDVEMDDTRSKSQSSDETLSRDSREIHETTRSTEQNSSFKSRQGGWDPTHEDTKSNLSEDGSDSFGSASFSSFIVPVVSPPISAKVEEKSTVFHSPTPHPFFWRSHPRATFTCYDTMPIKLGVSNTRFSSYYARGVVLNTPNRSVQTAAFETSNVALEPIHNDMEAETNAEQDFLLMNRKRPLLPKTSTPGRFQRFDPNHVRIFRKDTIEFPEIPAFSTNFGYGLEYTSSGDDPWTSPWDTTLSHGTEKI